MPSEEPKKKKKPLHPRGFDEPEPDELEIPEVYDDPDDPAGVKPLGELPFWAAESEPD